MPASDQTIQLELSNEQASVRFAEDLAACLKKGDCVTLSGDLGAGKTTIARALIRTIADDCLLEVPSPTFTLVQEYELRLPVGHLDLYRLSDPAELDELGLDDILRDGIALIEWPECAGGALPDDSIRVIIEGHNECRSITISGPEAFMERLKRSLNIRDFINQQNLKHVNRRHLQGDASSRSYERLKITGQNHLVLMDAPEVQAGPAIRDGKTYPELAKLATNIVPFLAIAYHLFELGLRSPKIHSYSIKHGLIILEDLGQEKITDPKNVPIPERYMQSIEILAHLHDQPIEKKLRYATDVAHVLPDYDADIMMMEVELLPLWYAPYHLQKPLNASFKNEFVAIWQELLHALTDAEKSLVLRDFHSPNILWQEQAQGFDKVGIIDFQDALIGPSAYDVASLAQDVRVEISEQFEQELVSHYKACRMAINPKFISDEFDQAYAILAAQRATKILGGFVRLDQRDGKPDYLKHLPQVKAYLSRSLRHPKLAPLRKWFEAAEIDLS